MVIYFSGILFVLVFVVIFIIIDIKTNPKPIREADALLVIFILLFSWLTVIVVVGTASIMLFWAAVEATINWINKRKIKESECAE